MSFVPYVPPATTPRARELAKAIDRTIRDFRRTESRTTDRDVKRALQLATARQGAPGRSILLVMAALGLVVLVLVVGMLLSRT